MNKDFKNFLITENDTISSCSLKMNKNNSSFLIVVNQKQLLLGTFSMGDLRNALFHGAKLNSHIIKYYNTNPIFLFKKNYNIRNLKKIFLSKQISVIPIVDSKRKIIGSISKESIF